MTSSSTAGFGTLLSIERRASGVSIEDFGAVAGPNVSDSVRTANTVAIQTAINTVMGDPSGGFGKGGDLRIPVGVFEINDVLQIAASGDTLSGLRLAGAGGRYSSVLKQMDPTKGVLKVTNTTLNIRSLELRDFTIASGTIGLEMHNEQYNLVHNVTFHAQTQTALYGSLNTGFFTRYTDCWFSDIAGNCIELRSGRLWMNGCFFGEASGGIYVDTGRIDLVDCGLFDCRDQLNLDTLGTGTPVIVVGNGGKLHIQGGYYWPRESGCVTFIYAANAGSIVINGGEFQMPANITGFIVEHQANTYGSALICRPDKVQSYRAAGLSMYRERSGTAIKARKDSLIDTVVAYTTVPPTVDATWSDPGQNNTTTLRPRVISIGE